MKTVKQVLDNYRFVDPRLSKLESLGLFEEHTLRMLNRAYQKPVTQMTVAEKNSILEATDVLLSNLITEKQDHLAKFDRRHNKSVSERDMPNVIVLRRKAIRVYPDNQKIGLYYSQALDRYISIPFGPGAELSTGQINEGKERIVLGARLSRASEKKYKGRPKFIVSNYYDPRREEAVRLNRPYGDPDGASFGERVRHAARNGLGGVVGELINSSIGGGFRLLAKPFVGAYDAIQNIRQEKIIAARRARINPNIRTTPLSPEEQSHAAAGYRPSNPPNNSSRVIGANKVPTNRNRPIRENFLQTLQLLRESDLHNLPLPRSRGPSTPGRAAAEQNRPPPEEVNDRTKTMAQGIGVAAALSLPVARAIRGTTSAVQTWAAKRAAQRAAQQSGRARTAGTAAAAAVAGNAISPSSQNRDPSSYLPFKQLPGDYRFSLNPIVGSPQSPIYPGSLTGAGDRANLFQQPNTYRESVITNIESMINDNVETKTIQLRENNITLNKNTARKILKVYESLNTNNKKKMAEMLSENATTFKKALNFILRH